MNKVTFNRFLGALKSRHPAAYLGIAIKGVRPVSLILDRFIYKLFGHDRKTLPKPIRCVMIVGSQRSGATIIYQAITRALPSKYISNVHALFPYLGSQLLEMRRGIHHFSKEFNNYYGYTPYFFDVYEGSEFFEFLHGTSADRCDERDLRKRFLDLIALLSPDASEIVVFKNARLYSNVVRLHRAVPEIVFLRIRRDPEQVVKSVLRAYHELGSFHPVPVSLQNKFQDDPVAFACELVQEINRELDEQFSKVAASAQMDISYENFCENPWRFVNRLAYDYLNLPQDSVRSSSMIDRLRVSKRQKVSATECMKIQSILQKANFQSE